MRPSDITLSRQVVIPMEQPQWIVPGLSYHDDGFFKGVARRISVVLFRFFAGARQFIFSDGFMKVSVKGHGGVWKLDSNGLYLDGGIPLFEVVNFEN